MKVVYDDELVGEYDLLASKEVKKVNFVSRLLKSLIISFGAMSKKPIIVFEGIEGSGKSHHISMFQNILEKKN